LKYGGARRVAAPLAGLMRAEGAGLFAEVDFAVPVPLHRGRRRARGFNQAADLARGLGLPVLPALRRIRATPPQVSLPAARRHGNVRDAFALASACRLRLHSGRLTSARSLVAGRCLLLVDDVATTGATLEACAYVLLRAGAREVRAITAAQAVLGRRR
jgi:predicted amidophosphoribosyltransferase